jgi:hypothetical protein
MILQGKRKENLFLDEKYLADYSVYFGKQEIKIRGWDPI